MKTKLERWAKPRVGDEWTNANGRKLRIVRVEKLKVWVRVLKPTFTVPIDNYRVRAAASLHNGATFKPAK